MDSEVSTRLRIEVSAARAWQLLRNLELADRYVPGVEACTLTSSQHEGISASRRIEQRKRAPMQETVVEWVDGEGFTLELHEPGSEQATMPYVRLRRRPDQSDEVGAGRALGDECLSLRWAGNRAGAE